MCGVLQAKWEYCELLPIPCTDGAVAHEPPTGQRLYHMQMPSQRDLLCRLSSTMHAPSAFERVVEQVRVGMAGKPLSSTQMTE